MPEAPRLNRLWRCSELADALGLSRQRIYELCRLDEIPHVRIGRSIRFDPDAVRGWLENGGSASE